MKANYRALSLPRREQEEEDVVDDDDDDERRRKGKLQVDVTFTLYGCDSGARIRPPLFRQSRCLVGTKTEMASQSECNNRTELVVARNSRFQKAEVNLIIRSLKMPPAEGTLLCGVEK